MTRQVAAQELPFRPNHDHGRCISGALAAAERQCRDNGARLTAGRRRILELVWHSHAPVGAYEILARLGKSGAGTAPPTVYRALEFLMEQGLVHRIESLNAFVGCRVPGERHCGQFLICRACRMVSELDDDDLGQRLGRRAARVGFAVEHHTVEISGLCPNCQDDPGAGHGG